MDRARKLRLPRLGDVVLPHLAGSPAGDVQEAVVHGKVDVGHQRRHCAEPLQERRQLVLGRRLGRDGRRLFDVELAAFAPPGPNGPSRFVSTTTPRKPYSRTGSCAGRTLQRHLMVGAEIDRLDVAPGPQIPKVDVVAMLFASRSSGTIPFSNCGGSPHSLVTM